MQHKTVFLTFEIVAIHINSVTIQPKFGKFPFRKNWKRTCPSTNILGFTVRVEKACKWVVNVLLPLKVLDILVAFFGVPEAVFAC